MNQKGFLFLTLALFLAVATVSAQQAVGRYVITVYNGYQTTTLATSDRKEAIAILRRVRTEGVRFVNPYTGAAAWWIGSYLDLIDSNDPSGATGSAKAILNDAFPTAAGVP